MILFNRKVWHKTTNLAQDKVSDSIAEQISGIVSEQVAIPVGKLLWIPMIVIIRNQIKDDSA